MLKELKEDLKFQFETVAIVEYLKLLSIYKLSLEHGISVFELCDGYKLYQSVGEKFEKGILNKELTNIEILEKLVNNLKDLQTMPISVAPSVLAQFMNFDWLCFGLSYINADNNVYSTYMSISEGLSHVKNNYPCVFELLKLKMDDIIKEANKIKKNNKY